MFYIELIRQADLRVSVEGLIPSDPDFQTLEEPVEAGMRVFRSRGRNDVMLNYPTANGFRVKMRGSENTEFVWTQEGIG